MKSEWQGTLVKSKAPQKGYRQTFGEEGRLAVPFTDCRFVKMVASSTSPQERHRQPGRVR